MRVEYNVAITRECNWYCSYCLNDTHNCERSYEEALIHLNRLDNGTNVNLTGGEPGLMTTEELMVMVNILKDKGCFISINTNGEIFNHPEVVAAVDNIFYHCSMDMDIDDKVNKEHTDITDYMVVVTDDNIHNLKPFIEKHSDIAIEIYPAKKSFVNGAAGANLSRKNSLGIIRDFRNYLTKHNIKILFEYEYCDIISKGL